VHGKFKRLSSQQQSVVALFPEKPSQKTRRWFPKLTASVMYDDLKGLLSAAYEMPVSRSVASVDAVIGGSTALPCLADVSQCRAWLQGRGSQDTVELV